MDPVYLQRPHARPGADRSRGAVHERRPRGDRGARPAAAGGPRPVPASTSSSRSSSRSSASRSSTCCRSRGSTARGWWRWRCRPRRPRVYRNADKYLPAVRARGALPAGGCRSRARLRPRRRAVSGCPPGSAARRGSARPGTPMTRAIIAPIVSEPARRIRASKRVLTGYRPTGPLHVGHWAGNVENMLALQADSAYECFFFIADWHMLTTHYDRTDELPGFVEDLVLDWLAAGLDPERAVIYRQSDLPEVAEMALLLGMMTPLGWLERVPSFKERLRDMAERDIANFGLLGYPRAAGGRHRDRSRRARPGRGGPGRAPRALPRDRPAVQPALRRGAGRAAAAAVRRRRSSPDRTAARCRSRSTTRSAIRDDEAAVRATGALVPHRPPEAPQGRPGPPRRSARSSRCTGSSRPTTSTASRRRAARASSAASTARRSLPTTSSSGSPRSGNAEPAGSHAGSRPRGAGGRRRHRPSDRAVHARDRPRRDASAMRLTVDATSQRPHRPGSRSRFRGSRVRSDCSPT